MDDGPGILAALGPFFAVERHDVGTPIQEPWRPMNEILDAAEVLTDRVRAVREVLAVSAGCAPCDIEPRVAASVMHLGLSARLISPMLGYAALTGRMLKVDLDTARWQPAPGGAFPLSLPWDVRDRLTAEGFIDGPIAQLVSATLRTVKLSPGLLWGNVASAVNGAAMVIATSRPDLGGRAYEMSAGILAGRRLRDSTHTPPGAGFRRRSCCLIYRTASPTPQAICGDCVFGA